MNISSAIQSLIDYKCIVLITTKYNSYHILMNNYKYQTNKREKTIESTKYALQVYLGEYVYKYRD